MAKLSEGRNWEIYVSKNKDWANTTFEVEYETKLFIRKNSKLESVIDMPLGSKFKLLSKVRSNFLGRQFASVVFKNRRGLVSISAIRKPPSIDTTIYEADVARAINKVVETNRIPINVKLPDGKLYKEVKGATPIDSFLKRTLGLKKDPKSDIIIYSEDRQLVSGKNIYISHKKGAGAGDFHQYGGVSKQSGLEIYNHQETQRFLRELAEYIRDKDRLDAPVFKKIRSATLKKLSIFGSDYGKQFGIQNVNLIGQGEPILKPIRISNTYELSFTGHVATNGDLTKFTGDYLPVFGAIYASDRSFEIDGERIPYTRVGIYPIKFMYNKKSAVEFSYK